MKLNIDTYENYLNYTLNDIIMTAEPENFDLYTDEELSKLDTFDKQFEYDLRTVTNFSSKLALENNKILSKTLLYQMTLKQILKYFGENLNE